MIRHESNDSGVMVGQPAVASSLQVYKQAVSSTTLPASIGSLNSRSPNLLRGRLSRPSTTKKSVGRPVRGGQRSLAQTGTSGDDKDRTRVNASLDCEVSLCNTVHRTHAITNQLHACPDQSVNVGGPPLSASQSSAEYSVSSNLLPSASLVNPFAATHVFSSLGVPSTDDQSQVLPAIAVISQPLPYQNRLISSPNNSDIPPALDVCTNAISGVSTLDSRRMFHQQSLLDLLTEDGVTQKNNIEALSNDHSVIIEQGERVGQCQGVDVSQIMSEALTAGSSETVPISISSVLLGSVRSAASVSMSAKSIRSVPSLSASRSKKSSSTPKLVLCKGQYVFCC